MSDRSTISVTAEHYARISATAAARGVTICSLVDDAVAGLPDVDVVQIGVSVGLRVRLRRACKRKQGRETLSRTLERAINAAIDDAERWPRKLPRKRPAPQVSHASRPGTRRRA